MAWGRLGSTTLSGYAENITYDIGASSLIEFMIHGIPDSTVHASFQFNSDTTAGNYNNVYQTNGGTQYSDYSNQTKFRISPDGHTKPEFFIAYMANYSGKEKLIISHSCYANTAGEATAPARQVVMGKWANTSDTVSNIKFFENTQAGGYTTGTNITTLGSDAGGASNGKVQDGAVFYEKDTNKEYILNNGVWSEL